MSTPLTWQRQCARDPRRRNWVREQREETRQEFATYHVQRFQRYATGPLHFGVLLEFYRELGVMYDRGHRLRDSKKGAA